MSPHKTSPSTGEIDRKKNNKPDMKIVWFNVFAFSAIHIGALYGFYLVFTSAKLLTTLYAYILVSCGGIGVTAGAHRLWSHKSYKANTPLRCLLLFFDSIAFQNSIYDWARDHRVHHKYSETNADPHNAARGFFFSHVGWLLCRKHPDVVEKGKLIDMSDLLEDPLVVFQRKYFIYITPIISLILPPLIPVYLWGETWNNAYFVASILRWTYTQHVASSVNSAAHLYGTKPYDRFINPAENLAVAIITQGEGWHNYHHTFPWDYKTAELGNHWYAFTTVFIQFFARIGWAYDLKSVSNEGIEQRVKRTGDGTHEIWGWGDKDQAAEERDAAIIEYHTEDQ